MLITLLLVAVAVPGGILSSRADANIGCIKDSNILRCDNSDLVDPTEVLRWDIHDVVFLSAAYNRFTRLNYGTLTNATNLTTLLLHHNDIRNIDVTSLCSVKKLKNLDLSFNKLNEFNFTCNCNISLLTLNISNNFLYSFSIAPQAGKTLRYLNLERNVLKNEIGFVNDLIALETLILGFNEISEVVSKKFDGNKLIYLHYLHLNDNKITDVSFLKAQFILYYLNLSNNNISMIPQSTFQDYKLLVELNLAGNSIEDVSFIENMKGKREFAILDISHNKINNINSTYFAGDQIYLTSLDVSYNDLQSISFVSNIEKLTSFRADNNRISFVSVTDISKSGTSNITHLSLSHNQISEIKFLSALHQLRLLNISYNKITETHGIFIHKNDLKVLDISHNYLSQFESIPYAGNFTFLDISFNNLHKIPCSASLETLYFDGNMLKNPDISCLPSLRRLRVFEIAIESHLGYRLQEAWVIVIKVNETVTKCRKPLSTVLTCKEACRVMGEDSLLCTKVSVGLIVQSLISICIIIFVVVLCIGITYFRVKIKKNLILECTCFRENKNRLQYVRTIDQF